MKSNITIPFIKKELALLLKELGFNEETEYFVSDFWTKPTLNINNLRNSSSKEFLSIINQEELNYWLYNKYNIHVEITEYKIPKAGILYRGHYSIEGELYRNDTGRKSKMPFFKKRNAAIEDVQYQILNNIKNENHR